MYVLKMEKKLAVISALVEASSIRSIERMSGVHRDTIMRQMLQTGQGRRGLMDRTMRGLPCRNIEVNEIWTSVRKMQQRLTKREKRNAAAGDRYTFIALDGDTNVIPCFEVGKCDGRTAPQFIRDLEFRLTSRIQLTSDGFSAYVDAVWDAWADEVDYT